MLVHHGVWFNDDTPLIQLLHHSKLLEQDLKKARERAMTESARTSGRGVVRSKRG